MYMKAHVRILFRTKMIIQTKHLKDPFKMDELEQIKTNKYLIVEYI